jgi:ribosomal protein S18 acetylase RimI-like enzyme
MPSDRVLQRPARPEDADAAAALLLELPGGLVEMLGDRKAARRAARAAFTARRSIFGADRTLLADEGGRVVGLIVTVAGDEWRRRRVPTGLAMLRGAGVRKAWRVVRRGRLEEMLVPPVPADALHVVALAVVPDRRGSGIGSKLLRHVVAEATNRFQPVTLDVGTLNAGAISLYERHGFERVSEHHCPARSGMPAASSYRMERSPEGIDSGSG